MNKLLIGTTAGLLALAGSSVAQLTEEVVIQASRVVNEEVVGRTASGIPVSEVSLTYRVSLAGLDPNATADFAQIEKRVNEVAETGCKELGRLYPNARPSDAACAKAAAERAMATVRQAAGLARDDSAD